MFKKKPITKIENAKIEAMPFCISVGGITMQSPTETCNELLGYARIILTEKPFKDFLKLSEQNKLRDYMG